MQRNNKADRHALAWIVDESFETIRKQNVNLVLTAKTIESLTRIELQTEPRKESHPAAFRRMASIRHCTQQEDFRQSPSSDAISLTFKECPDSHCGLRIAAASSIDYFEIKLATRCCDAAIEVAHRLPLYKILQRLDVKSLRVCVTEPKNKVGKTDKFYLSQRIKQCATTSVPTGVRSHGLLASV